MNILDTVKNAYLGYAEYLWNEIIHPSWNSYFYWLLLVSLFFFILEIVTPWRSNQKVFRKDFWLDFFYMFFNFFLFSLIIYNAASEVVVDFVNSGIEQLTGINLELFNPLYQWPLWAILLAGFILRDFIQWWVHRLLHRVPWLWNFHKVHHSVKEMGFAAHLRFHWMENIVYRSIEYLPLAFIIGINLEQFFIIHIFTLAFGHYNHSNISVDGKITGGIIGVLLAIIFYFGIADVSFLQDKSLLVKLSVSLGSILFGVFALGPFMKKIFNSPEMHIWHHAHDIPSEIKYGINFGLTLAIWDYIFGTDYIPYEGRDINLGFPGDEKFPSTFVDQAKYGF